MRLDEFKRPRAYNCYRFLRSLDWSRGRALRWVASIDHRVRRVASK